MALGSGKPILSMVVGKWDPKVQNLGDQETLAGPSPRVDGLNQGNVRVGWTQISSVEKVRLEIIVGGNHALEVYRLIR